MNYCVPMSGNDRKATTQQKKTKKLRNSSFFLSLQHLAKKKPKKNNKLANHVKFKMDPSTVSSCILCKLMIMPKP